MHFVTLHDCTACTQRLRTRAPHPERIKPLEAALRCNELQPDSAASRHTVDAQHCKRLERDTPRLAAPLEKADKATQVQDHTEELIAMRP